jgi:hypothetical protein
MVSSRILHRHFTIHSKMPNCTNEVEWKEGIPNQETDPSFNVIALPNPEKTRRKIQRMSLMTAC